MALFSALASIATLAGAAYGISSSQQRSTPNIEMPKSPTVEDAAKKAKETARSRQLAMARSQTVYTSPLGVGEEAATARKTLLGQ